MENEEVNNIFVIPANYTDSGKFAGGMFETRNVVEAIIATVLLGVPIIKWLPVSLTIKIVLFIFLALPIIIFALIGIDGDSLSQYISRIVSYNKGKRKLHLRRVGYKYNENDIKVRKEAKLPKGIS